MNKESLRQHRPFEKIDNRLRIKLLTASLETNSNFVVILDENRLIWWVNASFEIVSGFTLEEVIGKDISALFSDSNDPELLVQAEACLLEKREWRGEVLSRRKDGSEGIDGVSVTAVFDEVSEMTYYLVVGRDITEKMKMREALRSAREAQIKAEKMLSIGIMASGISHEINQPLNAIRVLSGGMHYLLGQGEKLSTEELTANIQEIVEQTDRIADILKLLRTFVRRDALRLKPCAINDAVELALALVGKQLADHGVRIQKELQDKLPAVMADITGLAEVMVNLLINAMQALDSNEQNEKLITVKTDFAGAVRLVVTDNGPGIDLAIGQKVFESFVSTKADGDNLGLGLAIVHTLVTSFGGSVNAENNETGGACFTVILPAIAEAAGSVDDENTAC